MAFLNELPPGGVNDTSRLGSLLARCWCDFEGWDAERMEGYKLHGRMENVVWTPPVLTFKIARHGAFMLGSSREEIHVWEVNIDDRSAGIVKWTHRQAVPMSPRLNVKPIADDIASLIIERKEDDRLKWRDDGSVLVRIGEILPAGSAVKQTLDGRRKRFREALARRLEESDWCGLHANAYAPNATRDDLRSSIDGTE